MKTAQHPRWQTFLSVLTHKGRKELTIPGIPEEIASKDLISLVETAYLVNSTYHKM